MAERKALRKIMKDLGLDNEKAAANFVESQGASSAVSLLNRQEAVAQDVQKELMVAGSKRKREQEEERTEEADESHSIDKTKTS